MTGKFWVWTAWAVLVLAGSSCSEVEQRARAEKEMPVVYGTDDRLDVYEIPDADWAQAARQQVVALMDDSVIVDSDPDNIVIWCNTLGDDFNLCAGERFAGQWAGASCSGTLIGPDLVLTAGHCMSTAADCMKTRFVFNYTMDDVDTLHTITSDDLYDCAEILVSEVTNENVDYAVVRLDRTVVGRTPAMVDSSHAALPVGTPLVVMGFPSGLPLKYADDATVQDGRATELDFFVANTDTFGGNSGSGVYRADTRALVGILVRGEMDYVPAPSGNCNVVYECPQDMSGCRGEDSTYAFVAIEALCAGGSDSPLCACGDDVCDAEESAAGSCCTDCGCDGGLVCVNNECISDPAEGDSCDWTIEVPAAGTQLLTGSNAYSSNTDLGFCGGDGAELIFEFTLAGEAKVTATAEGYDTVIYLRSACDNANTEMDCNDDNDPPGDYGSYLQFDALAAGTYFLFLDSFDETSKGDYSLTLTFEYTDPCPGGDADGDGVCDDVDGCPDDPAKTEPGLCGCGVEDTDTDSDGTPDCQDACPADPGKTAEGICGCGVADSDSDGDGVADCEDACPADPAKTEPGLCGCGVADSDSDGDGVADCEDACPDDPEASQPGECDEEPDPDPDPEDSSGCGCATGGGQPLESGLGLLLLLFGLIRRRGRV